MNQLPKPYQQFRQDHPDVYKAYENLGESRPTTARSMAKRVN